GARGAVVGLLRVHGPWGGGGWGGEGSPPGSGGSRGVAPQEHKVISAWAIHYSRRRQFAAETKARRGARRSTLASPIGFGRSYGSGSAGEPAPPGEAEAEKILKLLQTRATAARAEAVWADGTVEIAGALPAETGPAETGPAAGAAESAPAVQAAPGTTTAPAAQAAPGATAVAATGWTEPLTSTWSRRALAALLIPALILLIVVLI